MCLEAVKLLEYGIDVSEFQDNIDWAKVKNGGIDFAMVRAGFGETLDAMAHKNVSGAIAAGVKCGIYWFGYPLSEAEARREAEKCLEFARQYDLKYPIAYDFEYDSVKNMERNGIAATKANISAFVRAFCSEIESAGYYVMVYTNYDFYNNYFDKSLWTNYDMWLADWDDTGTVPRISYAHIVQYTSKGSVDGINGNVDRDYSVRNYADLTEGTGEPEKPGTADTVYTVKSGDTLWGIGQKFGVPYQTIAQYNGISDPSLIYPGQKIKIPETGAGGSDTVTYTVKSGDTLSEIGEKFGVSYKKIAADNGITNPNLIYPGQVLKIIK